MGQRPRHTTRQRSLEAAVLRGCGRDQRNEASDGGSYALHFGFIA
jgi:hypothetical protein